MNARIKRGGLRLRLPFRLLSVGATCTVVATLGLVAATPSNAAEVYPRPSNDTITLSGHGFGHGYGMSQWGAYGAATVGRLSWKQILAHYYPGTALSFLGNPTIRVRLDTVGTSVLSLPTPAGLTLAGSLLPTAVAGRPVTAYRVLPRAAGGVQVDARTAAGWTLYQTQASAAVLTNPSHGGIVDVSVPGGGTRGYRGSIVANRMTATSITSVSTLPMESYLRSVVPREMPASWAPNALASQAVAARSYAMFGRVNAKPGSLWDTCDTTSCQVYSGASVELAATTAAIAATAGQTVMYAGTVAFTQFSSSNGGMGASGGKPYFMAMPDPYDGAIPNNANTWSKDITVASIQSRWPSIGAYRQLRVLSRDGRGQGGGRVLTAAVDGSAGSVTVTGAAMRSAFGLKSDWFTPSNGLTSNSPSSAPVAAPRVVAPRVSAPARTVVAPRVPAWKLTRYTPYKKVVLRQGSNGTAVLTLQRALKVKADGRFGPMTRVALVAFQKKQHLVVNGVVSRAVWDRMEKRDYPLFAYRSLIRKQGNNGAVTAVINRALRLTAGGVFGPKTAAAVRALQGRAKMVRTGVVSGQTWVALENMARR